jgi:hypothetical protein
MIPVVDRERLCPNTCTACSPTPPASATPPSPATNSRRCRRSPRWPTPRPSRYGQAHAGLPRSPPTSASTTRRPPVAHCQWISRRPASRPTHSWDRHGRPSMRRSAPSWWTGTRLIEGLLNAVHLDHLIELEVSEDELPRTYRRGNLADGLGRTLLRIRQRTRRHHHVRHTAADGTVLANETERFAIRGRAYNDALPAAAPDFGGIDEQIVSTPRRMLRRVNVRGTP